MAIAMRLEQGVDGSARIPSPEVARRCIFPATAQSVSRVVAGLIRDLRQEGVGLDACARLEILLTEAMNNIVEHGMEGRDPGVIDLALSVEGAQAEIDLRDDGAVLPASCLALRAMPVSTGADNAAEGGYGWPLIRALSESIEYSRAAGWNRLRMTAGLEGVRPV